VLLIIVAIVGAFIGGMAYGSFFEWTLHRFLLHRPLWFVTYPFKSHALTHHVKFGSGPDYHLREDGNKHLVTMAWWNSPVLIAVNAPVGILAAWLIGSWWIVPGFLASMVMYYGMYEYLHWCMHVPKTRWFQSTRVFKWIDRHHRIHHLVPMSNLNVVLPLADFLLRTRMAAAPAPVTVNAK
jgi:hypothetical protein